MIHTMILLMVLALALGVSSIAVSRRYWGLYRLESIKYLIAFLVALNAAAVTGILFNYFGENLRGEFSESTYTAVDTGYRLIANIILLVVGGSLVLMLRSLVNDTPSNRYLVVLAIVWGLVIAASVAGIWVSFDRSPMPLTVLANIALDQLVQYLVLFECIRAWFRATTIRNGRRRTWTKRFLALFAAIWLSVIAMSFLMLTDEVGNRLFNLLSAIVYVVLNSLPLMFLGTFLRHAHGRPAFTAGSNTEDLETLCERFGVSRREREIIQLIRKGCSNKEIADELFISLSTVKDHNHNIFRKLNVSSRTQLIARVGTTAT